MGFFDKVKSFKNAITGGAASVVLESSGLAIGETFEMKVSVDVKDADINVKKIYLYIEGREAVEVPDTDVIESDERDSFRDRDGFDDREQHVRHEIVRKRTVTVKLDLNVCAQVTLDANEHYEWVVTVELPQHAQPPYHGRYCQHTYHAKAGLDCVGNDPDSGWIELS